MQRVVVLCCVDVVSCVCVFNTLHGSSRNHSLSLLFKGSQHSYETYRRINTLRKTNSFAWQVDCDQFIYFYDYYRWWCQVRLFLRIGDLGLFVFFFFRTSIFVFYRSACVITFITCSTHMQNDHTKQHHNTHNQSVHDRWVGCESCLSFFALLDGEHYSLLSNRAADFVSFNCFSCCSWFSWFSWLDECMIDFHDFHSWFDVSTIHCSKKCLSPFCMGNKSQLMKTKYERQASDNTIELDHGHYHHLITEKKSDQKNFARGGKKFNQSTCDDAD